MVKKLNFIQLLILISALLMSCSKREKVDLIITNARIYTVDSTFSVKESMAIKNGLVVATGDNKTIVSLYTSDSTVDAKCKPVFPGFFDPHCHFLSYGLTLSYASLSGAAAWEEVVTRLVDHQQQFPADWVLGRGWNQNEWDVKEFPTNELLNKAFPDKPVLITRIDGHAAIANNRALEIAGVNLRTRVDGGSILSNKGKLTGVLVDNAIELVRKFVPVTTEKTKEMALMKAQQNCFAVGLTSVSDAGIDYAETKLYDSLQKKGSLKMRVYAMLSPTKDNFENIVSKGIFKTDRLTICSIKLYADGALGSRGALLLKPYSDDPGNSGLQVEKTETLSDYCSKAFAAGYQVNTHCIGDAGVRLMLDIYSKFLTPGNDRRWRIEHAQVVDPQDLPRFGQLRVIPSVQTTHATSDMYWADERLGERIKYAYAYKDLLEQNGWLPNGSDFPIENINPLYGFYAGVVRKDLKGFPEGGFQMENAISREQALKAMTIWAAKANFEEKEKGSLEPGKYADFVILEKDIMTASESELPLIKVITTYIAGEPVYTIKE